MLDKQAGDYLIHYFNARRRIIVGLVDTAHSLSSAEKIATIRLTEPTSTETGARRPFHYVITRIIQKFENQ